MFEELGRELISIGSALLVMVIGFLFRLRPMLKWSRPHAYRYALRFNKATPDLTNVWAVSVFIQNVGRVSAKEIQVVFSSEPEHLNVLPHRPYEKHIGEDGLFTLELSSLAPKERFRIDIFSLVQPPEVLNVRSSDATAQQVAMVPVEVLPPIRRGLNWALWWFGLVAAIYLVIIVIGLISQFFG